eukprot:scaffold82658_cov40-Cyclotella_meneghiniana.AAC.1
MVRRGEKCAYRMNYRDGSPVDDITAAAAASSSKEVKQGRDDNSRTRLILQCTLATTGIIGETKRTRGTR